MKTFNFFGSLEIGSIIELEDGTYRVVGCENNYPGCIITAQKIS